MKGHDEPDAGADTAKFEAALAAHRANGGPNVLALPSRVTGPRTPIVFSLIAQGPVWVLLAGEPSNPDAGAVVAMGPIDSKPMIERIMADARNNLTQ